MSSTTSPTPPPAPLLRCLGPGPDGRLKVELNFHRGQWRAWESSKRIVAIIAGGRSGKTSFAACWLWREMVRQGPGDYLACAPSYPLIDKALGPEIQALFETRLRLGMLRKSPYHFQFSEEGARTLWGRQPERPPRILFGHADDPQSLEAMSVKAAILDEAGQNRFKVDSWEVVQQRVAIDRGRILITSKPYNLAWLKTEVYDPWVAAKGEHPDIDVVEFDSTWNPAFPREEWERALRTLPRWKFDMHYRGKFTRPAGLIYDCYDESRHVVRRFRVPQGWPRFAGIDFGARNTAGVLIARDPGKAQGAPGEYVAYREYHPAERLTPEQHRDALLDGEPGMPCCVGGSGSEDDWRERFARAGLPIREPPVRAVEVGIDAVYALFRRDALLVMEDLHRLRDQLKSYSRVLTPSGEPTAEIDAKDTYHVLDALRYIGSHLERGAAGWGAPAPEARSAVAAEAEQVFAERQRGRGRGEVEPDDGPVGFGGGVSFESMPW